jgi:hypothetical protein
MRTLSGSRFAAVFAALLVAMLATRFKHFGDALHLPDASMAVFFLGGLFLRRHWAFAALVALAVLIDWASIRYAGVSDFCVTEAYAFLPLAYAVLWYGGRWYAPRLRAAALPLLGAFAAALAAAAVSFAISNGSFYWLGGRYAAPNLGQYLERLGQWGPLFVRTTLGYVAVVLAWYGALARTGRAGAGRPA